MTDRVQSLTVMLDDPIRTDDVQAIVDAIAMVKGVAKVELGEVMNPTAYFARQKASMDLANRIHDILRDFALGK